MSCNGPDSGDKDKTPIVSHVKTAKLKLSSLGLPFSPVLSNKKPSVSAGRKLFDKFFARRESSSGTSADNNKIASPKFSSVNVSKPTCQWFDRQIQSCSNFNRPQIPSSMNNPEIHCKTERLPRRLLHSYRCFWQNATSTDDVTKDALRWHQKARNNKMVWSLVDVFEQSTQVSNTKNSLSAVTATKSSQK